MKKLFPIICVIFAIISLGMILFPISSKKIDSNMEGFLSSKVSKEIGSLKSEEKALGQTEEVIRATEQILSVSDYLNREYTLPNGEKFTLYISYWAPNREEIVKATTHTPDRCWVKNGWKNDDSKRRNDVVFEIDGKSTMPAYYRELTVPINANKEYRRNVIFWFIADGKIYDYSTSDNYVPSPWLWVKNAIKNGIEGSPEMYFVRIDGDGDLMKLTENADVKKLLNQLGEMILYPKAKEDKNGAK